MEMTNSSRRPSTTAALLKCNNPAIVATGAAMWLAGVVAVMIGMMRYANTPSRAGEAPKLWPAESRIPRDTSVPTLVMFVHPRCPCTRASLGELGKLLARRNGQITAHVLFVRPPATAEDWAKSDLWHEASAMPGLTIHCDDAGTEARRFHAMTSGQSVLYDRAGRLIFQGGITLSRGHSGDNPGRAAIEALVLGQPTARTKTPVFGCALLNPE